MSTVLCTRPVLPPDPVQTIFETDSQCQFQKSPALNGLTPRPRTKKRVLFPWL